MYFPWPGFFELVAKADVYIHLDDAQFSRGSFTNRVQIKHQDGVKWLSVPLQGKGTFKPILELSSANSDWRRAHRTLLAQCLTDAPHLDEALALFDEIIAIEALPDMLCYSIDRLARAFGIAQHAPRLWASQLDVGGQSWRRVLDLVHAVGGTRYLSAQGGRNYLAHDVFEREGVAVEYVNYSLRPWKQFHGAFTPYVSALDLVAHCGTGLADHFATDTIPWRRFVEAN